MGKVISTESVGTQPALMWSKGEIETAPTIGTLNVLDTWTYATLFTLTTARQDECHPIYGRGRYSITW